VASPLLAGHSAQLLAGLVRVRAVRLDEAELRSLAGPAIAARLQALRLAALA
jgi:hypothetical protein